LTASIAVHLAQRGFQVRLLTAAGEEHGAAWHERTALAAETGPLLEALAVVGEAPASQLDVGWLQDVGHTGLLVAVLGRVVDYDKPALSRIRHSATTAMAVSLEVGDHTGDTDTGAGWLKAHGWKAVAAGPRDPLPTVWETLGRSARGTGRRDVATREVAR
jgi:hypothetical protein